MLSTRSRCRDSGTWSNSAAGDLGGEVAPRDPGFGPRRILVSECRREHDLGNAVHRRCVWVVRCGPGGRHLLVGGTTHEMSSRLADPVEFPLLQLSTLRDRHAWMLALARDEPVQRHRHVQDDVPQTFVPLRILVTAVAFHGVLLPRCSRDGSVLAHRVPQMQHTFSLDDHVWILEKLVGAGE